MARTVPRRKRRAPRPIPPGRHGRVLHARPRRSRRAAPRLDPRAQGPGGRVVSQSFLLFLRLSSGGTVSAPVRSAYADPGTDGAETVPPPDATPFGDHSWFT